MGKESRQKLAEVFGYQAFRPPQEDIVDALLSGEDQMVIMPTGGGKSICYQLPATLFDNLTIVVSPLIALMEDQVNALLQLGIRAAALHSGRSTEERNSIESKIHSGDMDILYLAPETILQESMISFLQQYQVDLIAIDEAHCVSVWGNDFRPEYVALKSLRKVFPDSTWIALTATADEATRHEIQTKLGLEKAQMHISSFERKNLTINALPGQDRIKEIGKFLALRPDDSGIIYCLSRRSTEEVARKLEMQGISAAAYHAGMDSQMRSDIQTQFQNDDIKVICATIAFGMGIDKSNVRYVIHYNLPKNIESYYQEIGRAGRDGVASETLLFYSWRDVMQLKSFIDGSDAADQFKKIQHAKLDSMWELATSKNCRTNIILNYFGEYRNEQCGHCDNCLYPSTSFDGTVIAQKAMSAVARSQQSIGLTTLLDVLKGAYKPEIRQQGLDRIKTFGAGRDLSYPEWREYTTQMIQQGLLSIDYTDSYRVKLTPLSAAVLKGESSVSLFTFEKYQSPQKTPKVIPDIMVEDTLYQILRTWRSTTAKSQRVPAYTIFHDRTLQALSSSKPMTDMELLEVDGIGKAKLEKYGTQIINMIREYVEN